MRRRARGRAADGAFDERAFDAVYEATLGPVHAHVQRRLHPDRSSVDDVVAEVYVVAARRFDELLVADSQLAWLHAVAHRVLSNHRRSKSRAAALADRAPALGLVPDLADDVVEDAATRHRLQAVGRALEALAEIDREIVLLTAWEGLSRAEVAAVLGITDDQVRSRLHRARKKLEAATEGSADAASLAEADRDRDVFSDPDTNRVRRRTTGATRHEGHQP